MPKKTARRASASAKRPPAKAARSKAAKRSAPVTRKTAAAHLERVYVKSRAEWRRWLHKNHARSPGIWLVFDKKSSRPDRLPYADSVEEALCYGWIDSTARPLDDAQYMQLFTPRKPTSTWSKVNKERVARLLADGLIAPAGLASIDGAKANGTWSALDSVEALEIPPDLAAAFSKTPDAARNFAAFPPSSRKGYLHWVRQAVRPETRAQRIAETIEHCAANRKARQLAPKKA